MLFGFLVSVVAGLAVRPLERQMTDVLARFLAEETMPDAPGRRVAAFAMVLMLAALLLEFSGSGAGPFVVILGGFVGYFQKELREAVLNRRA